MASKGWEGEEADQNEVNRELMMRLLLHSLIMSSSTDYCKYESERTERPTQQSVYGGFMINVAARLLYMDGYCRKCLCTAQSHTGYYCNLLQCGKTGEEEVDAEVWFLHRSMLFLLWTNSYTIVIFSDNSMYFIITMDFNFCQLHCMEM